MGPASEAHDQELDDDAAPGDERLSEVPCEDGRAAAFECWNVDLVSWIAIDGFGLGSANDIWGWTDPVSGREIAIIGFRDGTAFVDLAEPAHPVILGWLPTRTRSSLWRGDTMVSAWYIDSAARRPTITEAIAARRENSSG